LKKIEALYFWCSTTK